MFKALILVSALILSGCVGGDTNTPSFECFDGRMVLHPGECLALDEVHVDFGASIEPCHLMEGEGKDMCYADAAIRLSDLSVCDNIEDMGWRYICYQKLGGVWIWDSVMTSSTATSTTTTSTSTSSTMPSLCGNGVIDGGESCDIGSLCEGADGVCGIGHDSRGLVTCMVDGVCDWNNQVMASGGYDMGSCNQCYGPGHERECQCM
jgi:hypothetical protein